MTATRQIANVHETVTVNTSIDRAFEVFTANITSWWPAEHHIGDKPFAEVVIEPRAGGRFFERDADGTECLWGSVLAYDPPHRVVLGWHLQPDWNYDADPGKASEVAVRFIEEGPNTTRVELEHGRFERHGTGGEEMRNSVDSDGGWAGIMRKFQAQANA